MFPSSLTFFAPLSIEKQYFTIDQLSTLGVHLSDRTRAQET